MMEWNDFFHNMFKTREMMEWNGMIFSYISYQRNDGMISIYELEKYVME